MLDQINVKCGAHIKYLAELDVFHVKGAGEVVAEYIDKFFSESVKVYLIPQLLLDRINDCDRLVLQLYEHFRMSDEYISAPGRPAPSHICARYDNAFCKLKSKRIAADVVNIVSSPRDAFYLPLTVKMLASWRLPLLKQILLKYLNSDAITIQDVGLYDDQTYYPPFSYITRELKFIAMNGLAYYPSQETTDALSMCMSDPDSALSLQANRILKKMSGS